MGRPRARPGLGRPIPTSGVQGPPTGQKKCRACQGPPGSHHLERGNWRPAVRAGRSACASPPIGPRVIRDRSNIYADQTKRQRLKDGRLTVLKVENMRIAAPPFTHHAGPQRAPQCRRPRCQGGQSFGHSSRSHRSIIGPHDRDQVGVAEVAASPCTRPSRVA